MPDQHLYLANSVKSFITGALLKRIIPIPVTASLLRFHVIGYEKRIAIAIDSRRRVKDSMMSAYDDPVNKLNMKCAAAGSRHKTHGPGRATCARQWYAVAHG